MDSLTDEQGINAIIVYENLEYILDIANQQRIQREEKKRIQDYSINYILKECDCLVNIRLFYHDIEEGPYKLTDEDEEPQSIKADNMQCFSIAKRKRMISQNQDDHLSQNSFQMNYNHNDSSQVLTAQQILNIMNNKQGSGLFLTPIKDRSYVRSLIAKEKMKNMSYQDVLNNSITYYGKEGQEKKATNLFNKYVKGHSLGPLKIDQQISPLRVLPKELQLPKNVAFQKYYPQDIIEQLEDQVKIENLNLDTRKISLDVSQLDYSKIKLQNQKTDANLETLMHVPTYQSLFQQNILKYENSQLTLPTTQITSSQPHISIQASNINQLNQKQDEYTNNNVNNLSSIKQINAKQERYHIPQQYRQQVYSRFNNQELNLYSISPIQESEKPKRTLSSLKQNDKRIISYNEYDTTRNQKNNQIRSLERNGINQFEKYTPIKYDSYSQQGKRFTDHSFDNQIEIQNSVQVSQQQHNNSIEFNQGRLNSFINELENEDQIEANQSSILQQNLENYKKQKVMRKELSQLILERKKQQKNITQLKNNNDKSKIIMFEQKRNLNNKHRLNVSPLPTKLNNSSQHVKEILNQSLNYSSNNVDYLYQPQIFSQYNSNHLKQPSYLPSLKTQRLSYNI